MRATHSRLSSISRTKFCTICASRLRSHSTMDGKASPPAAGAASSSMDAPPKATAAAAQPRRHACSTSSTRRAGLNTLCCSVSSPAST